MNSERSTPLRPAVWMTGVLVWATVIGLFLRVPTWAGILLCTLTALSFAFYLGLYVYLVKNDWEPLTVRRQDKNERALEGGAVAVEATVVPLRDPALERK